MFDTLAFRIRDTPHSQEVVVFWFKFASTIFLEVSIMFLLVRYGATRDEQLIHPF